MIRAPECWPSEDRSLAPAANGVFRYGTKELLPFWLDLVLLAKLSTRLTESNIDQRGGS